MTETDLFAAKASLQRKFEDALEEQIQTINNIHEEYLFNKVVEAQVECDVLDRTGQYYT